MLADQAVLDAEEPDRPPHGVLAARRELDELPGLRPLAVHERRDVVALADHLVDGELHVREARPEHLKISLTPASPGVVPGGATWST